MGLLREVLKDFVVPVISPAMIAAVLYQYQKRIERAKFISEITNRLSEIYGSQTAWRLENGRLHPVDFRYALGTFDWAPDPSAPAQAGKRYHEIMRLPLARYSELKPDYFGLIYDLGDGHFVASKPLIEMSGVVMNLIEAYDSGLICDEEIGALWRPLNMVIPAFGFRPDYRRPHTSKKIKNTWRWFEFFIFGNLLDEVPQGMRYKTYLKIGSAIAIKQSEFRGVSEPVAKV